MHHFCCLPIHGMFVTFNGDVGGNNIDCLSPRPRHDHLCEQCPDHIVRPAHLRQSCGCCTTTTRGMFWCKVLVNRNGCALSSWQTCARKQGGSDALLAVSRCIIAPTPMTFAPPAVAATISYQRQGAARSSCTVLPCVRWSPSVSWLACQCSLSSSQCVGENALPLPWSPRMIASLSPALAPWCFLVQRALCRTNVQRQGGVRGILPPPHQRTVSRCLHVVHGRRNSICQFSLHQIHYVISSCHRWNSCCRCCCCAHYRRAHSTALSKYRPRGPWCGNDACKFTFFLILFFWIKNHVIEQNRERALSNIR